MTHFKLRDAKNGNIKKLENKPLRADVDQEFQHSLVIV